MSLTHVGIYNPGSTCWLACCVHALAGVGQFRRLLYKIEVVKNRPNETEAEVNTHNFIEQFQLAVHHLEEREDEWERDEMSTRSAFRYIKVDKLRKAGETHYANPDLFHATRHEDCCEHFFHILQTISEYYSKYFQKAEQNPDRCFAMATTEWNGALQKHYNIILPVTATSFYAALREAWFPKNRLTYDKEKTDKKEEDKHWVKSLPDVLTFTINRSGRDNTKSYSTFKIELEIALDRHLESRQEEASKILIEQDPEKIFKMNENDWSKELYTLTAVIMHKGEGTAHGHYTIFVLDLENSVGELKTDYKYKRYNDHRAPQEYTVEEAQKKWTEGNTGRNNCPSMLIYTKNEALAFEMDSFLEKKIEDRSKSMKDAIGSMVGEDENQRKIKENGNQAEKNQEDKNQADKENGNQTEKNYFEMEVTAVEPMRKRNANTPVAVARQIVNPRESSMEIQLPTMERSVAHSATAERSAVHPLVSPMIIQVPPVERSTVFPIESSNENLPTRSTKQIQQTGNYDIRLNSNNMRRRTQTQQRRGTKVTVLPRRDLQTFLGSKLPDTFPRPPLSSIQHSRTESGTTFLERMTKKIQEIREPAQKVSRLESFISAEDSGYDDPEEEEEEEDDKAKKAWARMTEILKVNTARMENEQSMMSEVREQLRSSLDDTEEWATSSTANSSEDRAIAITAYFDCRYSDYDNFYPHKKDVEKYLSGKEKYIKTLDTLFKMKFRNVERNRLAVRKQHLSMFRQSLQKYLPTELREELSRCNIEYDGKMAMTNVLEWMFEHKISDKSGWWKSALIFSLFCDGDLSPAPATQAIIEVLPINHTDTQSYFTRLSDKDQSCPAIIEYLYNRYDVFLFTINEYAECISIWRLNFPLRDKYEAAARETDNFKMESLLQCYNGMIRHLLPIFAGLHELSKGQKEINQPRILGIDKTVLARMGAYTYALAVLRLLHASRRMEREGNVGLADGTHEEEDRAVEANKVTMLDLVKSVLRATVKLSKLLEWWKTMMGENKDIDHAMTTMADALRRVESILQVNVYNSHECNLSKPLETLDPNWREASVKSAESLLTRGSWLSEKEALVKKSMDDNFQSIIETVRDCEAHSHCVRGEREDEDDVHLPKQRNHRQSRVQHQLEEIQA